ncbi:LacI family DNA-binding transcriptional regulator [Flammeovirga agarivorans]|uniref:LacI family transcriptional regulator n=1 Tax=Flammeovirga agarivorans TaxID=2726742 RepID=A0A7X8SN90_9BACT|nr:LacI family DNA-binding transcriptional regulator [Flammeovirga agarivorans]NLR93326.1 LacI family transcriptional regulator [Flammeovirga agarivorans]
MRKERVTIKDIAKALGVTPTTVSRALNGGERISEKTRNKVIALAKEWNYRPNMVARNLQNQSSKTVGVVIPEFNHNFFSVMLHGVEDKIRELGYQMLVGSSGRDYDQEKRTCFQMSDAKVDGLLIALSQDTEDYSYLNEIRNLGIPIVLLDRICEDIDTSVVITDDFNGAFKAVNHLLEKGHQRILHVKGEEGISTTFNRYMGYVEAIQRKGLILDTSLIINSDDKALLKEEIKASFEKENRPTAIFTCSDYLAFVVLETIKELGLSVPHDVSIIGYADEPISTYTSPKLSTIKQPSFEMGKKAVEILFDYEKADQHQHVVMDTEIILRESTIN